MKREVDELERGRKIEEAKRLAISAPVLLPLLEERKTWAIERIIANYREGKHSEQISPISELCTIDDLIRSVTSKLDEIEG